MNALDHFKEEYESFETLERVFFDVLIESITK